MIAHFKNTVFLGIDRDPFALELNRAYLDKHDNVDLYHGTFSCMGRMFERHKHSVDAILLDIGFIDTPERGFSFKQKHDTAPLDMRMDTSAQIETAADIINSYSIYDLAYLFKTYGEEKFAQLIAREIVRYRTEVGPIKYTSELSRLITDVYPAKFKGKGSHPATKVFQALRVKVNDELGELEQALDSATSLLRPGGRLCIITFQPSEQRVLHNFFSQATKSSDKQKPTFLKYKKLKARPDEVELNPRARTAVLYWATRTHNMQEK